jgi:hypothetical protein
MKNKNKVTGVIKSDKCLDIKVKAELKEKDPENAKEVISTNTTDRRKNVKIDRENS